VRYIHGGLTEVRRSFHMKSAGILKIYMIMREKIIIAGDLNLKEGSRQRNGK
jgi:hypothetical protein